MKSIVLHAGAAAAALLSFWVAQAQSPLGMKQGAGGSEVQGSAGTTGSQGDEKDGYFKVESGSGGGWVKKVLVTR